MRANQMRDLTEEELADKYRGFKDELFNLRFQLATGQLEKFSRIKAVRKDLARILTIMHQKQQQAQVASGGSES